MKINTEFSKYKSIHDDALSKLLSHACATVPYYKKYCGKAFDEFPIVSKADYKEDIDAFVSEQFKKEKLFKSSTSRSTGTPFVVFQDPMKRVRVHSELIAFNALVGQNVGDKYIFFRVWTDKNKKAKLSKSNRI